jgi:hypothetical protein
MKSEKKKQGKQVAPSNKPARVKVGDLVLVEHGSSARGQVAVIVAVRDGLVGVRKYIPASESFAVFSVRIDSIRAAPLASTTSIGS